MRDGYWMSLCLVNINKPSCAPRTRLTTRLRTDKLLSTFCLKSLHCPAEPFP
jgi:hypothetical protein